MLRKTLEYLLVGFRGIFGYICMKKQDFVGLFCINLVDFGLKIRRFCRVEFANLSSRNSLFFLEYFVKNFGRNF